MSPFEKSSFFSDDQLWLISIEQGLQADWQAKNRTPESLHVPQTWKINIYVVSSSQHNQKKNDMSAFKMTRDCRNIFDLLVNRGYRNAEGSGKLQAEPE